MSEIELLPSLPPRLVRLLERELLAVDVETFWERVDAIGMLLPQDGPIPDDLDERRARAAALLSPGLAEAVREIASLRPDADEPYALRDLLTDWESLRLDEEKLVGHLLLVHGQTHDDVVSLDHDHRVLRHADLHEVASLPAG